MSPTIRYLSNLIVNQIKKWKHKQASDLHYNDSYDTNNNKEKEGHDTPVSCNLMKEAKQVNPYNEKN